MAECGLERETSVSGPENKLSSEDDVDGELDPRVKGELDNLNSANEDINRLEKEFEEARQTFASIMEEATEQLNTLRKNLSSSVEKARPYFEMRRKARRANIAAQLSAQKYETVIGQLSAAREMVARAEENILQGSGKSSIGGGPGGLDQTAMAWMESLNYATVKVMEVEKQRQTFQAQHQHSSQAYLECEQELQKLYQKNKRNIKKAMPYFERHASFYLSLERQKQKVQSLQDDVNKAKERYRVALANLEAISEEIHQARSASAKSQMKELVREAVEGAPSPVAGPDEIRTDGVGAESAALDLALTKGVGNVLAKAVNLSYSCSSLDSLAMSDVTDNDLTDTSHAETSLALELQAEGEPPPDRPALCGQSSSPSHSSLEGDIAGDCKLTDDAKHQATTEAEGSQETLVASQGNSNDTR